MKKLLLAFIVMASISTVSAQEFRGWTIKTGANYSTIKGDKGENYKFNHKLGFTGGVSLEWAFTDIVGFSADLMYSRLGGDVKLNKEYKIRENSNYFNLPLQANIYLTETLTLRTGVQVGYFVSADDELKGPDLGSDKYDLINAYNTLDVTIPVGLNYVTRSGISFEARYNFGMTNIVKSSLEESDYKAKNRYVSLTIGYRF